MCADYVCRPCFTNFQCVLVVNVISLLQLSHHVHYSMFLYLQAKKFHDMKERERESKNIKTLRLEHLQK